MRGLDLCAELARRQLKNLIDNVADFGLHALEGNVPSYSTYTLRHTDRSDIRWNPGGAGGGGEYEVIVGIKAGTSKHPIYVKSGTGIYGFKRIPYGALKPRTSAGGTVSPGLMFFYSQRYGHVISVRSVKGQKPQDFLYTTYREMQVYTGARLLLGAES